MTGYLGRVSAGHVADALTRPPRPVARVVRAARKPVPARGEVILRQPIQAVAGRVDKRPNGPTEGARGASGKAVFHAGQGAAPVTRGKGHALVVSAVLSVGGGGGDHSGGPTGIALRRAGDRSRFHPRAFVHAHFAPTSSSPRAPFMPLRAHFGSPSRAPPHLLRISLTSRSRRHRVHRFPSAEAGTRRTRGAIRVRAARGGWRRGYLPG